MTAEQIRREPLIEFPTMTPLQRALLVSGVPILDSHEVEQYKRRAKFRHSARVLLREAAVPFLLGAGTESALAAMWISLVKHLLPISHGRFAEALAVGVTMGLSLIGAWFLTICVGSIANQFALARRGRMSRWEITALRDYKRHVPDEARAHARTVARHNAECVPVVEWLADDPLLFFSDLDQTRYYVAIWG